MAAILTPKTIKLKADTTLTSLAGAFLHLRAGTDVGYHEETRRTGTPHEHQVGVVELERAGVLYRAEKPLARKTPCACPDHDRLAEKAAFAQLERAQEEKAFLSDPDFRRSQETPKPAPVAPRTITNSRDGQTVETTLTNSEAADAFARLHGGSDANWLWYWIHRAVNDAKPPQQGGRNVTSALDFLADSFVVAVGYGLLRPMIRVHYKDQRFKFYLSARGTICLKSGGLVLEYDGKPTNDPVGEEEYVGCLLRGQFLPNRDRKMTVTETEFLAKLGADPVAFLAQCSKDMCRCCYCYAALEDARSKEKGYGPVCAKRWGLPWGDGKAGENTPSFARSYNATAHDLLAGIRANPTDSIRWAIFGDWLEENGLNRCEMPTGAKAAKTRLPRND